MGAGIVGRPAPSHQGLTPPIVFLQVCVDQQCQDVAVLEALTCLSKCSGHGVRRGRGFVLYIPGNHVTRGGSMSVLLCLFSLSVLCSRSAPSRCVIVTGIVTVSAVGRPRTAAGPAMAAAWIAVPWLWSAVSMRRCCSVTPPRSCAPPNAFPVFLHTGGGSTSITILLVLVLLLVLILGVLCFVKRVALQRKISGVFSNSSKCQYRCVPAFLGCSAPKGGV